MNRNSRWRLVGIWIRLFATAMLAGGSGVWFINTFLVQEGARHLIDWEELSGIIGLGMGCVLAIAAELRFGRSKVFHYACVTATIAGLLAVTALAFCSSSAGLDAFFSTIFIYVIGCVSGGIAGLSLIIAIVVTSIRDRFNPDVAKDARTWTKMLITGCIGVFAIGACGVACVTFGLTWPDANTLVRQAKRNNVVGMKRSLFIGVDPNDFQQWGVRGDCDGETALTAAARTESEEQWHSCWKMARIPTSRTDMIILPCA